MSKNRQTRREIVENRQKFQKSEKRWQTSKILTKMSEKREITEKTTEKP